MKKPVKEIGLAIVVGVACTVSQTFAASRTGYSMQVLDSDHDGTVDLNEAKSAAAAALTGSTATMTARSAGRS